MFFYQNLRRTIHPKRIIPSESESDDETPLSVLRQPPPPPLSIPRQPSPSPISIVSSSAPVVAVQSLSSVTLPITTVSSSAPVVAVQSLSSATPPPPSFSEIHTGAANSNTTPNTIVSTFVKPSTVRSTISTARVLISTPTSADVTRFSEEGILFVNKLEFIFLH